MYEEGDRQGLSSSPRDPRGPGVREGDHLSEDPNDPDSSVFAGE